MNILFLIGNGFDLNLGMKTSYRDFYKHYTSIKSSSSLIQKLKNEIDGKIENWSDLELSLGKYTSNLSNTMEFNEVYEDIEDNLADYLDNVEKNFDLSKIDGKKLFKYFATPEISLPASDKNQIIEFKRQWTNHQWNINVITFNYTNSLEKLLNYKGKEILLNENLKNLPNSIYIQRIEHIHGFINERMVMGVNDISQIANHVLHNDQEVLETLVKKECYQAQKHLIDNWCKTQISNANLICIFGSSIGDTDNLWWELIGEQLKQNCRLIIFEKGEIIPPRRPQKKNISERKKKRYFIDKTKLNDQDKESVNTKIFIGINTEMFNCK